MYPWSCSVSWCLADGLVKQTSMPTYRKWLHIRSVFATMCLQIHGPIMLIILFLVSHFNFLFIPCGRLNWLAISFLLHVKYTLSCRIYFTLLTSVTCVTSCDDVMCQIGERDNPMYGQLINNLQNVAYYGQWLHSPSEIGAVGLAVEYRTRNREVVGSTHTRSTAHVTECSWP